MNRASITLASLTMTKEPPVCRIPIHVNELIVTRQNQDTRSLTSNLFAVLSARLADALLLQEAEMTAIDGRGVICAVQVLICVDTHQDEHVAVAIDQQGVRLAPSLRPATSYGYGQLERWSRKLGEVRAFGVEGTGFYGAGLARVLTGRGFTVVEVNRPDRSTRYRKCKSDYRHSGGAASGLFAVRLSGWKTGPD